MLVKDWMSKTVITVDINDSMQGAMKLLKENAIPMLPVEKGQAGGDYHGQGPEKGIAIRCHYPGDP